MFKENKYYGEVWFVDKEEVKCFCVLTFIEGKVSLETNLRSDRSVYKLLLARASRASRGFNNFNFLKSHNLILLVLLRYHCQSILF